MFLDLENLNVDQLLEKQIEIRKKFSQAQSTGMIGVLDQMQNMLDQISIEIRTKSALQAVDKEREKAIEAGKDPDDDVLNIGEIE